MSKTPDPEFDPKYPVHYVITRSWLAECGKPYLQATGIPKWVTCKSCKRVLVGRGLLPKPKEE